MIGILFLTTISAEAMDAPGSAKETTILKMIALARPDFQKKYDEVMGLDLENMLKTRSLYEYPREQRQQVIGVDSPFQNKRLLMQELSEIKAYAPLIPVLFGKWKGLEKHWISSSMLYHAVHARLFENTHQLLNCGVDPNRPGFHFFDSGQHEDLGGQLPLRVALGKISGLTSPQADILKLLLDKGAKVDQKTGRTLMFDAIELYLHVSDEFAIAIECLLDLNVDPFVPGDTPRLVRYLGKSYAGNSPARLVQVLSEIDLYSPEIENVDYRESSENFKNRFRAITTLFQAKMKKVNP